MRQTVYPSNHRGLKVDIPYSMGVKQDGLFALCGQADLKGMDEIQNPGDLHANVNIRSSYFNKPGSASTGIPLDFLAYEGMLTEFEAIAITEGQ